MRSPSTHHPAADPPRPKHLELKQDHGLTIHWRGGGVSFYPIAYLRRMSPSADARLLREQIAANPLTVLPPTAVSDDDKPLVATGAKLVGNYAVCITFSDGHDTGIYSWSYLQQIDPAHARHCPKTGD